MSKPKPQTVTLPQSTTNEYQFTQAPSWQEFDDAKAYQFNNDLLTPEVDAQYAHQQSDLEDQMNSAFAGNLPESVKMRIGQAETSRMNRDRSNALAQGQYNNQQQNWEQKKFLAALRAPQQQLVRSSGYNTQQAQQQSGGLLNTALTAGATVLGAFL